MCPVNTVPILTIITVVPPLSQFLCAALNCVVKVSLMAQNESSVSSCSVCTTWKSQNDESLTADVSDKWARQETLFSGNILHLLWLFPTKGWEGGVGGLSQLTLSKGSI